MQSMFVAHGPFSAVLKALHQSQTRSLPDLLMRALPRPSKGWYSTVEDTYVMEGFRSVEVYNLIMRLLGVTKGKAPNNGTEGFWDQYF